MKNYQILLTGAIADAVGVAIAVGVDRGVGGGRGRGRGVCGRNRGEHATLDIAESVVRSEGEEGLRRGVRHDG